jgi:signal transduction histidine kinase
MSEADTLAPDRQDLIAAIRECGEFIICAVEEAFAGLPESRRTKREDFFDYFKNIILSESVTDDEFTREKLIAAAFGDRINSSEFGVIFNSVAFKIAEFYLNRKSEPKADLTSKRYKTELIKRFFRDELRTLAPILHRRLEKALNEARARLELNISHTLNKSFADRMHGNLIRITSANEIFFRSIEKGKIDKAKELNRDEIRKAGEETFAMVQRFGRMHASHIAHGSFSLSDKQIDFLIDAGLRNGFKVNGYSLTIDFFREDRTRFYAAINEMELLLALFVVAENARKAEARNLIIRIIQYSAGVEIDLANDGKPLEVLERDTLFNKFARGAKFGEGLGLYFAKEALEKYGASISYKGKNESGFEVFSIYLIYAEKGN